MCATDRLQDLSPRFGVSFLLLINSSQSPFALVVSLIRPISYGTARDMGEDRPGALDRQRAASHDQMAERVAQT